MDYHVFMVLYAIIFGASSVTYEKLTLENDCVQYAEITKKEIKFAGRSCYVKQGDDWVARRP